MRPQTILLPKEAAERRQVRAQRVATFLGALDPKRPWEVLVRPYHKTRSTQQNAYLWGVVYETILTQGGETLGGWTKNDLHDFFLIEHFGHEVIEGFGRRRLRPLRRSSNLNTVEFMDFLAFIQRFMAEQGIYVPDPNEYREAA